MFGLPLNNFLRIFLGSRGYFFIFPRLDGENRFLFPKTTFGNFDFFVYPFAITGRCTC